jgi:hypothetical protein
LNIGRQKDISDHAHVVNLKLSGRGCNVPTRKELVQIVKFTHGRCVLAGYGAGIPFLSGSSLSNTLYDPVKNPLNS